MIIFEVVTALGHGVHELSKTRVPFT